MRDHEEEFGKRNIKIVVITFESNVFSRRFVEETSLAWPLLLDEARNLYRSYGMLYASFWDIWGPKTWLAYFMEIGKGQRLTKSEGDIRQRGGDVLIDSRGIVRFHHVTQGPADRPRIETILKIIDGVHHSGIPKILLT